MPTYTVEPGDSWTKIAGKVYGDQREFWNLQQSNPQAVLKPGDTLYLPDKSNGSFIPGNWQQQLASKAGMPSTPSALDAPSAPKLTAMGPQVPGQPTAQPNMSMAQSPADTGAMLVGNQPNAYGSMPKTPTGGGMAGGSPDSKVPTAAVQGPTASPAPSSILPVEAQTLLTQVDPVTAARLFHYDLGRPGRLPSNEPDVPRTMPTLYDPMGIRGFSVAAGNTTPAAWLTTGIVLSGLTDEEVLSAAKGTYVLGATFVDQLGKLTKRFVLFPMIVGRDPISFWADVALRGGLTAPVNVVNPTSKELGYYYYDPMQGMMFNPTQSVDPTGTTAATAVPTGYYDYSKGLSHSWIRQGLDYEDAYRVLTNPDGTFNWEAFWGKPTWGTESISDNAIGMSGISDMTATFWFDTDGQKAREFMAVIDSGGTVEEAVRRTQDPWSEAMIEMMFDTGNIVDDLYGAMGDLGRVTGTFNLNDIMFDRGTLLSTLFGERTRPFQMMQDAAFPYFRLGLTASEKVLHLGVSKAWQLMVVNVWQGYKKSQQGAVEWLTNISRRSAARAYTRATEYALDTLVTRMSENAREVPSVQLQNLMVNLRIHRDMEIPQLGTQQTQQLRDVADLLYESGVLNFEELIHKFGAYSYMPFEITTMKKLNLKTGPQISKWLTSAVSHLYMQKAGLTVPRPGTLASHLDYLSQIYRENWLGLNARYMMNNFTDNVAKTILTGYAMPGAWTGMDKMHRYLGGVGFDTRGLDLPNLVHEYMTRRFQTPLPPGVVDTLVQDATDISDLATSHLPWPVGGPGGTLDTFQFLTGGRTKLNKARDWIEGDSPAAKFLNTVNFSRLLRRGMIASSGIEKAARVNIFIQAFESMMESEILPELSRGLDLKYVSNTDLMPFVEELSQRIKAGQVVNNADLEEALRELGDPRNQSKWLLRVPPEGSPKHPALDTLSYKLDRLQRQRRPAEEVQADVEKAFKQAKAAIRKQVRQEIEAITKTTEVPTELVQRLSTFRVENLASLPNWWRVDPDFLYNLAFHDLTVVVSRTGKYSWGVTGADALAKLDNPADAFVGTIKMLQGKVSIEFPVDTSEAVRGLLDQVHVPIIIEHSPQPPMRDWNYKITDYGQIQDVDPTSPDWYAAARTLTVEQVDQARQIATDFNGVDLADIPSNWTPEEVQTIVDNLQNARLYAFMTTGTLRPVDPDEAGRSLMQALEEAGAQSDRSLRDFTDLATWMQSKKYILGASAYSAPVTNHPSIGALYDYYKAIKPDSMLAKEMFQPRKVIPKYSTFTLDEDGSAFPTGANRTVHANHADFTQQSVEMFVEDSDYMVGFAGTALANGVNPYLPAKVHGPDYEMDDLLVNLLEGAELAKYTNAPLHLMLGLDTSAGLVPAWPTLVEAMTRDPNKAAQLLSNHLSDLGIKLSPVVEADLLHRIQTGTSFWNLAAYDYAMTDEVLRSINKMQATQKIIVDGVPVAISDAYSTALSADAILAASGEGTETARMLSRNFADSDVAFEVLSQYTNADLNVFVTRWNLSELQTLSGDQLRTVINQIIHNQRYGAGLVEGVLKWKWQNSNVASHEIFNDLSGYFTLEAATSSSEVVHWKGGNVWVSSEEPDTSYLVAMARSGLPMNTVVETPSGAHTLGDWLKPPTTARPVLGDTFATARVEVNLSLVGGTAAGDYSLTDAFQTYNFRGIRKNGKWYIGFATSHDVLNAYVGSLIGDTSYHEAQFIGDGNQLFMAINDSTKVRDAHLAQELRDLGFPGDMNVDAPDMHGMLMDLSDQLSERVMLANRALRGLDAVASSNNEIVIRDLNDAAHAISIGNKFGMQVTVRADNGMMMYPADRHAYGYSVVAYDGTVFTGFPTIQYVKGEVAWINTDLNQITLTSTAALEDIIPYLKYFRWSAKDVEVTYSLGKQTLSVPVHQICREGFYPKQGGGYTVFDEDTGDVLNVTSRWRTPKPFNMTFTPRDGWHSFVHDLTPEEIDSSIIIGHASEQGLELYITAKSTLEFLGTSRADVLALGNVAGVKVYIPGELGWMREAVGAPSATMMDINAAMTGNFVGLVKDPVHISDQFAVPKKWVGFQDLEGPYTILTANGNIHKLDVFSKDRTLFQSIWKEYDFDQAMRYMLNNQTMTLAKEIDPKTIVIYGVPVGSKLDTFLAKAGWDDDVQVLLADYDGLNPVPYGTVGEHLGRTYQGSHFPRYINGVDQSDIHEAILKRDRVKFAVDYTGNMAVGDVLHPTLLGSEYQLFVEKADGEFYVTLANDLPKPEDIEYIALGLRDLGISPDAVIHGGVPGVPVGEIRTTIAEAVEHGVQGTHMSLAQVRAYIEGKVVEFNTPDTAALERTWLAARLLGAPSTANDAGTAMLYTPTGRLLVSKANLGHAPLATYGDVNMMDCVRMVYVDSEGLVVAGNSVEQVEAALKALYQAIDVAGGELPSRGDAVGKMVTRAIVNRTELDLIPVRSQWPGVDEQVSLLGQSVGHKIEDKDILTSTMANVYDHAKIQHRFTVKARAEQAAQAALESLDEWHSNTKSRFAEGEISRIVTDEMYNEFEGIIGDVQTKMNSRLEDAITYAAGETNRVLFDYAIKSNWEELLRYVSPFTTWQLRNPFLWAQIFTQNPGLLRNIIRFSIAMEMERQRMGLTERFQGTIPIQTPGGGAIGISPQPLTSIATQFQEPYMAPETEEFYANQTGVQKMMMWMMQLAGYLGVSFWPWWNELAEQAGIQPEGTANWGLGSVQRGAELIGQATGQLGMGETFTGYTPSSRWLAQYYTDRRLAEMEAEGYPGEHGEYIQALGESGEPLNQEAYRQAKATNIAVNAINMFSPLPIKYSSPGEVKIRQQREVIAKMDEPLRTRLRAQYPWIDTYSHLFKDDQQLQAAKTYQEYDDRMEGLMPWDTRYRDLVVERADKINEILGPGMTSGEAYKKFVMQPTDDLNETLYRMQQITPRASEFADEYGKIDWDAYDTDLQRFYDNIEITSRKMGVPVTILQYMQYKYRFASSIETAYEEYKRWRSEAWDQVSDMELGAKNFEQAVQWAVNQQYMLDIEAGFNDLEAVQMASENAALWSVEGVPYKWRTEMMKPYTDPQNLSKFTEATADILGLEDIHDIAKLETELDVEVPGIYGEADPEEAIKNDLSNYFHNLTPGQQGTVERFLGVDYLDFSEMSAEQASKHWRRLLPYITQPEDKARMRVISSRMTGGDMFFLPVWDAMTEEEKDELNKVRVDWARYTWQQEVLGIASKWTPLMEKYYGDPTSNKSRFWAATDRYILNDEVFDDPVLGSVMSRAARGTLEFTEDQYGAALEYFMDHREYFIDEELTEIRNEHPDWAERAEQERDEYLANRNLEMEDLKSFYYGIPQDAQAQWRADNIEQWAPLARYLVDSKAREMQYPYYMFFNSHKNYQKWFGTGMPTAYEKVSKPLSNKWRKTIQAAFDVGGEVSLDRAKWNWLLNSLIGPYFFYVRKAKKRKLTKDSKPGKAPAPPPAP